MQLRIQIVAAALAVLVTSGNDAFGQSAPLQPTPSQAALLATKLLARLDDLRGKAGAAWTRR